MVKIYLSLRILHRTCMVKKMVLMKAIPYVKESKRVASTKRLHSHSVRTPDISVRKSQKRVR